MVSIDFPLFSAKYSPQYKGFFQYILKFEINSTDYEGALPGVQINL